MAPVDERLQDYVSLPLPEVLSELVKTKASGILTAMGAEAHRGIILLEGKIKAARSTLEAEKLGLFLISRNWLDENDRRQALMTQATADAPPLGKVLISRGFITASELEDELQELTLTIIRRAASDTTAYPEFFEKTEDEHLNTLPQLTTTQILLTVGREFGDSAAKYRCLSNQDRRVQANPITEGTLEDLEVTPTEGFILSRTYSGPRLQDLIQGASMPEDQAISTIYTLLISGLITLESDEVDEVIPEASSPSPAAPEFTEKENAERQEIERVAASAPRTDHYQALEVARTATTEEIIDSWSSIRQRYAPSRTSENHLSDLGPCFDKIQDRAQDAYQVLGDPSMRHRYDSVLAKVDKDRGRRNGEPTPQEADPEAKSALVEANLKRADELIRDGEVFSALQMLEQACAMDPRPGSLLKLAQLQLKNPKWDTKSLRTLHRALEADPKFIDAWLELANFWQRRNDDDRRKKALEKVLTLDPTHAGATKELAGLTGKSSMSRLRDLVRFKKK